MNVPPPSYVQQPQPMVGEYPDVFSDRRKLSRETVEIEAFIRKMRGKAERSTRPLKRQRYVKRMNNAIAKLAAIKLAE